MYTHIPCVMIEWECTKVLKSIICQSLEMAEEMAVFRCCLLKTFAGKVKCEMRYDGRLATLCDLCWPVEEVTLLFSKHKKKCFSSDRIHKKYYMKTWCNTLNRHHMQNCYWCLLLTCRYFANNTEINKGIVRL